MYARERPTPKQNKDSTDARSCGLIVHESNGRSLEPGKLDFVPSTKNYIVDSRAYPRLVKGHAIKRAGIRSSGEAG
jgi:hypothetical protein